LTEGKEPARVIVCDLLFASAANAWPAKVTVETHSESETSIVVYFIFLSLRLFLANAKAKTTPPIEAVSCRREITSNV